MTVDEKFLRADGSSIARRKFKMQCVEYKGGSCVKCGYSNCLDALTFHHEDPQHKDFEISRMSISKSSFERCRAELDKCILLCSNCHIEEHYLLRADAKMEMLDVMSYDSDF